MGRGLSWLFVVLSMNLVAMSCGGGSDTAVPTAATQSVATAVSSPAPQATPGQTVVPPAPTAVTLRGTVFENAGISRPQLEGIRYGGIYRNINTDNIATLDPKYFTGSQIASATLYIADKMFRATPNDDDFYSTWKGDLAESWSISDDLKTYTFKLRQGVKWHNVAPVNGRELTVDDVLYNINRYKEDDSIVKPAYSQIESATAPDKSTIVIKIKEPNAWLINDLWGNAEVMVAPELVKETGGRLGNNFVGTGPFILQEHTYRVKSVYVRNPDYWQKDKLGNRLPYIDTWISYVILDPATRLASFRTGQTDTGASVADIPALLKENPSYVVNISTPATSDGIAFNTKKAPWSDIRVRRAWNMAFDRQRVKAALNQTSWVFNGPMPWVFVSDKALTYDDLGPDYKYDPEAAKKLLIEAGYPDGKFKTTGKLEFGQSYADRVVVYQAALKTNGIEFDLLPLDVPTYQVKWFFRTYEDLTLNHWIQYDWNLNWFANYKFSKNGAQNPSFIDDPEVEKVIKSIKTTTDPAKQREYAKFLWDFDTRNSYSLWAGQQQGYGIRNARTKNLLNRVASGTTRQFVWLTDAPRTTP